MSNPAVFVDCDEGYAVEWVGWGHNMWCRVCVWEKGDQTELCSNIKNDIKQQFIISRTLVQYTLHH